MPLFGYFVTKALLLDTSVQSLLIVGKLSLETMQCRQNTAD